MNTEKKITQIRSKMVIEQPFFSSLVNSFSYVEDENIESFKSSIDTFLYNPDFIETLNDSQITFILNNAAMHQSLRHTQRKSGRLNWLWEMATDYAINDMLVENGFELPPRMHYDRRFSGEYAEEIYETLLDEIDNKGDNAAEDSKSNAEEKEKNNDSNLTERFENKEQSKLQQAQMKERLNDGLTRAKQMHNVPESIERIFSGLVKTSIDWRNELSIFLNRFHSNDYRISPPNKKYLYMDLALPSAQSEHLYLVVGVDVSGSIDENKIELFISELESLLMTFNNFKIDLFFIDSKIKAHYTYENGDTFDYEIPAGSSTDFRPLFDYIETNYINPDAIIYFTDADGIFPTKEPLTQTIWIVHGDRSDVPFGRIIKI